MNILEQVKNCASEGEKYRKLEKEVLEQIKDKFIQEEIPILNSKMLPEYSIGDNYAVWINKPGEKPNISLMTPEKTGGNITKGEMNKLNEILSKDFIRIEKTYGVSVQGFQFEDYA